MSLYGMEWHGMRWNEREWRVGGVKWSKAAEKARSVYICSEAGAAPVNHWPVTTHRCKSIDFQERGHPHLAENGFSR